MNTTTASGKRDTEDYIMGNKFDDLARRANEDLGLELFEDRVRLNSGIVRYHLRADPTTPAWPHFATLDDVAEYLDACSTP